MTPLPRFVAYYRVSTDRQGRSGLGLDAQREAVAGQVNRVTAVFSVRYENGRESRNARTFGETSFWGGYYGSA